MTPGILRQIAGGFASIAAALNQAADEIQPGASVGGTAAEVIPADKPAKGKPGPKPKAKVEVTAPVGAEDPLAGLTGGASGSETSGEAEEAPEAADPLAGLMGGEEEEAPAAPVLTREDLLPILREFSALVDGVKGKGKGADALKALFTKHNGSNLKDLPEDEFLAVKNEATAVIDAIKNMQK